MMRRPAYSRRALRAFRDRRPRAPGAYTKLDADLTRVRFEEMRSPHTVRYPTALGMYDPRVPVARVRAGSTDRLLETNFHELFHHISATMGAGLSERQTALLAYGTERYLAHVHASGAIPAFLKDG